MPLLTELLKNYHGTAVIEGDTANLSASLVTADSRQVAKGAIFAAIRGNTLDGSAYAIDALEKGAVAILADHGSKMVLPKSAIIVRVDNVRLALSKIAEALYVPQPKHIAAITGTDGKTSTADFLRQLWYMDHIQSASIGTLGVIDEQGKQLAPGLNTTPDPVVLHQTLQTLAKNGCDHVSMEASSHGLHQYRLDGVHIQAAAFTNLTRDHLDYHETIEAYFQAKARLFSEVLPNSGTAVLNADDPKFRRLSEICKKRNITVISFGNSGANYKIKKVAALSDGLGVQADINGKPYHFMLNMIGEFQVMNALTALGLYVGCSGDLEEGIKHLPHLHNVKGRLEKVAVHPDGAPIFIDYAHTPSALANALKTTRNHVKGRLVVIFGCGGDRDKGKRSEMGKVATELADEVIVTDDNPRSEDPNIIRKEVLVGAPRAKNIGSRDEAITCAVKELGSNDVLLIAGKGHENTQIIGKQVLPFNDGDVAREAVKLCEKKKVS